MGAGLGAALAGAAPRARAHDVWITPSSFRPQAGQPVDLRLDVGEHLVGETLRIVPGQAKRFVSQHGSTRQAITARLNDDIAGRFVVNAPGLYIVGYHSEPSFIELPADKFTAYLLEEGLDSIVNQRARRQHSGVAGRELFARCAKSLMMVGAGGVDAGGQDQSLGLPLELVAERNPYTLAAGDNLPLRLGHLGKPLAGALVVAQNSLGGQHKQAQRSDRHGRVHFNITPGGMWLIKAVHMTPAPPGWGADWSSLWASLTFELPTP